jgi:hypothetical protein
LLKWPHHGASSVPTWNSSYDANSIHFIQILKWQPQNTWSLIHQTMSHSGIPFSLFWTCWTFIHEIWLPLIQLDQLCEQWNCSVSAWFGWKFPVQCQGWIPTPLPLPLIKAYLVISWQD